MATSQITEKQWLKIKSFINNCQNKVFSSFDSLNKELSPGLHLVDTFTDCFSFISVNQKDSESLNAYWDKLHNIYKDVVATTS